jgi:cytochrome P450
MAELRRNAPADDLTTSLLQAEVDGEQLSDLDFNLFFLLMVIAGSETTRNAISHGLLALLEHPDQLELLRSDLAAHSLGATNEILRWASPVIFSRRAATRDVDYRGFDMKKGDKVSVWYASANRDEEVFHDPFTFDITRHPNPHITLGLGPHFCLGANLATLEIRVFFEELLTRVSDIQLLGEPIRLRSNFLRGIKHMPVCLRK